VWQQGYIVSRTTRETQAVGAPPSLQQAILSNVGWFIASLIAAVFVWYLATSVQNPIVQQRLNQRVPIEVRLPEGYIVVQRTAETALVTVRTLQSIMNELGQDDIKVIADFSDLQLPTDGQPVERTIAIQGNLVTRRGVVTDITPRTLRVTLAIRGEKLVTVNIVPSQELPVGFLATEILPSETQVKVIGPKSVVDTVAEARANISLQNQTAPFVRNLTLTPLDTDGNPVTGVTVQPSEVTVKVTIQERDDVTGLQVVPNYIGTLPEGYQLKSDSWEPRRIFVRGDQNLISAMNGTISTEAIDLSERTQTFTQSVRLQLPDGVTMPDPTDVTITVVIEPILITREFANILVQTQGLDPADYSISLKPDRVRVRVTGPQTIVANLQESDISVYAPLNGLTAGTHIVTVQGSVSAPELSGGGIEIPENQVEVTIMAHNPTQTPTTASTPATATP
jgi:YbbR domain-containing protein